MGGVCLLIPQFQKRLPGNNFQAKQRVEEGWEARNQASSASPRRPPPSLSSGRWGWGLPPLGTQTRRCAASALHRWVSGEESGGERPGMRLPLLPVPIARPHMDRCIGIRTVGGGDVIHTICKHTCRHAPPHIYTLNPLTHPSPLFPSLSRPGAW